MQGTGRLRTVALPKWFNPIDSAGPLTHDSRFSRSVRMVAVVLMFLAVIATDAAAFDIFDNDRLRFGNGSENSVNTTGNLQQPFYYNQTYAAWRKLTYSTYPLNQSFALGGDGTNEWNTNGTRVDDPTMTGQVIDTSGFTPTSGGTKGYGTIISTGTITIASQTLEITNTYELLLNKSYITVTTRIRNTSGSPAGNIRMWVGTRDDWVGTTDSPFKERGNLVDGAFAQIANAADRALAIKITSGDEGVLFYTNSSKANTILNDCCSWTNVINQDPQTSAITHSGDGSYGFYVRLNDLADGASDQFTWYYAAGELADLDEIIGDVAAASGSVSDITYTTAVFKATTSEDSTGYWVVVPRDATAPTESEIKAGVNYGAVTVVASGSGSMTANVEATFNITGLSAGTSYDLYFVAENAVPAFSSIVKAQFATPDYTYYTLTITKAGTGMGTVTSGADCTLDWVGNTGTCSVIDGTAITLSGNANAGSTWDGWSTGTGSVSGCSGTGGCNFNITEDSGVTATFSLNNNVNVASATGQGNINIQTSSPGCGFYNVSAKTEAQVGNDLSCDYPYGLVEFSISCSQADVTITFPGDVSGTTYRKYGPTTPGNPATTQWYDFNNITVSDNQVTLHLQDNVLGDDTGLDGVIVDQGGPGQQQAVAVPAVTEWGTLIFIALAGLGAAYYLKRQMV